jgi:hypothetical protein
LIVQRSLALLAIIALAACTASRVDAPSWPNALTEVERAHGTQLLFDGRTTAEWRAYRGTECPAGWQAVKGTLTRVAEAGDIVTREEYQDFLLEFEWKVAPGANSGVMFHVTEDHDYPWETGPEYQILDDEAHQDGLDPRTSAGSNYAMHAPTAGVTRPAGEWNLSRILVCGPHVEHWLNGVKIVDYELWTPDWEKRVSECKWKERPDYGRRRSGHIALQDHGDPVAFRNLKIQRIEPVR